MTQSPDPAAQAEESVHRAVDLIESKIDQWYETLVTLVPNLIVALVVVALFWIVGRLVRSGIRRVMEKTSDNRAVTNLVSTIASIGVLLVGLFIGLEIMQLDKAVTSLLAGAGVLGLALGFAFQDIAANFMSGVMISARNPFRVGDLIESNGYFGTVDTVNLRNTVLVTSTGQRVLLPNKEIFENPLVNYTSSGQRRIDLEVGVSYADDLERVEELARRAVEGVLHRTAGREAEVFYQEFGGSSINFLVRFWISETRQGAFHASRSDAIKRIKSLFDAEGITIPFPIRTLDFGIIGGEGLDVALGRAGVSTADGRRDAGGAAEG
ncbi:MAG: mechanosensitive ion channel domain-containing protein [Acidobacteriota bacterium]